MGDFDSADFDQDDFDDGFIPAPPKEIIGGWLEAEISDNWIRI